MQFESVQRIAAPLKAVETAFVDPGFLSELALLPKLGHPELLEQRDTGDEVWQRVRYAFSGDLSSAVKAVVDPDLLTWVEESTLVRRTHTTRFRVLPDHYGRMLEASGVITLAAEDGEHSIRQARGDVVVHVPIVGKKVEAAIVSGLREQADLEIGLVERWAAEHASRWKDEDDSRADS